MTHSLAEPLIITEFDEFQKSFAHSITSMTNWNGTLAGHYSGTEMTSSLLFNDSDPSNITGSDLESIFDWLPESEADSITDALSSFLEYRHFDHIFGGSVNRDTDATVEAFTFDANRIEPRKRKRTRGRRGVVRVWMVLAEKFSESRKSWSRNRPSSATLKRR